MGGYSFASRPVSSPQGDAGYGAAWRLSRWGAIAYSPSTRRTGCVTGYDSQALAERAALAQCGAPDAFVIQSVGGDMGLAVAVADDGGWAWGANASDSQARREALSRLPKPGARIVAYIHPSQNVLVVEDDSPPPVPGAVAPLPARPRSISSQRQAWRWGGLLGLIAALAMVSGVALTAIWQVSAKDASAPRGLLILGLTYLVALLCPLGGFLTARETGRVREAVRAGFITGVLWTVAAVAGIAWEQTRTAPNHGSPGAVALGYGLAALIFLPLGGLIGAALGALGGLAGRGFHRVAAS